jgi:hypothetical protein
MNDENQTPSIGGANLECLFSYNNFGVERLEQVVDKIVNFGFSVREDRGCLLVRVSGGSLQFDEFSSVGRLIEEARSKKPRSIKVNFSATIEDVQVPLSLRYDLPNFVVALSVPENMIWEFSEDVGKANKSRLRKFIQLCKRIAEDYPPAYAHLGTEGLHSDEIAVENAQSDDDFAPFDGSMFSEESIDELFRWYTESYVGRWE